MSKRTSSLLIAAVLLIMTATSLYSYDPPTDDELKGWWAGLSTDERLAEIRKLDAVEHETPTVTLPTYTVIATDSDVYLAPRSGMTFAVGPYSWTVTLPNQTAPFSYKRPFPTVEVILAGVAGVIVGSGVAALYAIFTR